ncbi:MAG: glucose-6-phosphate dehydrogenase [Candidatus Paceibacterota bacterium]
MIRSDHNSPIEIVIFGGTGDLAQTKLLPALLDLYIQKELPDQFCIIGLSRKELTDEAYREYAKESFITKGHDHSEEILNEFCKHLRYVSGSFDTAAAYEKIKNALIKYDTEVGQCTNKLFYLAVPPQHYNVIFDALHESDLMALCDDQSWSRLLVEKPFGKDLTTALALEKKLCSLYDDDQIYRIDHYLAKDAIENIIALRFVNGVLADSWNGKSIESIRINLLETKDVSNRGAFYDGIGTLRDVGQNHMLQLYALFAMHPGDIHTAAAIREARAVALENLAPETVDTLVRARYSGYEHTVGVEPDSKTETYFTFSFTSSAPEWQGTKFIFEAGKAFDRNVNEAIITFRPLNQCNCGASDSSHEHRNVLTIQFAPIQHISLSMWTKKPGFVFELQEQELVLVSEKTENSYSPEAYERVLFDCIAGDQTRFVSSREVEASWRFITPILEQFAHIPLLEYEPGSSGPVKQSTSN